jgi:hypothetical protein
MTREVELWRYRKVVIGTAGTIQVDGDWIMPQHAEITVGQDGLQTGVMVLRALEGPVWVDRHGHKAAVTSDWQLADGDVILIGSRRLRYRDLGSPPGAMRSASEEKEVVPWMV